MLCEFMYYLGGVVSMGVRVVCVMIRIWFVWLVWVYWCVGGVIGVCGVAMVVCS